MKIITRADAKLSGLKRYFTGLPCKHGHVAERTVCDHCCVECGRLKARDPDVREKRREYMRDHMRRYRAAHPERIRAVDRKRDKAKRAAEKRLVRAKDPEKHRSSLRKGFQKHKAKRMAESRAWRAQNPEAYSRLMRAAKARRRAQEKLAEGRYKRQDIERLLLAQRGICAACLADISKSYHVDHIHPLARGGTNWPHNLQLLCQPCNNSKGAKTMDEWAARKAEFTAPAPLQNDGRGRPAARLPLPDR